MRADQGLLDFGDAFRLDGLLAVQLGRGFFMRPACRVCALSCVGYLPRGSTGRASMTSR